VLDMDWLYLVVSVVEVWCSSRPTESKESNASNMKAGECDASNFVEHLE
jgi:hypothetical protein